MWVFANENHGNTSPNKIFMVSLMNYKAFSFELPKFGKGPLNYIMVSKKPKLVSPCRGKVMGNWKGCHEIPSWNIWSWLKLMHDCIIFQEKIYVGKLCVYQQILSCFIHLYKCLQVPSYSLNSKMFPMIFSQSCLIGKTYSRKKRHNKCHHFA